MLPEIQLRTFEQAQQQVARATQCWTHDTGHPREAKDRCIDPIECTGACIEQRENVYAVGAVNKLALVLQRHPFVHVEPSVSNSCHQGTAVSRVDECHGAKRLPDVNIVSVRVPDGHSPS
jgi:hypothetical protein